MSMWAISSLPPPPVLSSLPHNHLSPSPFSFNISFFSSHPSAVSRKRAAKKTVRAIGESSSSSSPPPEQPIYFQGFYGPWTIEPSDIQEVILYRSGLVTAAASFVIASSTVFLPSDSGLADFTKGNLDLFYGLGACGLGLSLYLIHIYVTEIKRTLQALWILGVIGSLATYLNLAQPSGKGLVEYVIQNPTAVWFVGPLFAAHTGLVFKEGLCYGKLEAGLLTFIIPSVLLGHLEYLLLPFTDSVYLPYNMTSLMDDGVKVTLLGIWMSLFLVFAGRKFYQPIKDDIGDKSVFMFNALSEVEKEALVEKLKQQIKTSES